MEAGRIARSDFRAEDKVMRQSRFEFNSGQQQVVKFQKAFSGSDV